MAHRHSYKGVTIAKVNVPRYEVRRPDGKAFKTFASLKTAKAFVDGFTRALKSVTPKDRS